MKVKICGITTFEEIEYINKLKPEYIGFVFTKSKREISINVAQELINKLDKNIMVVGVFKDNTLLEIENITREVNLDIIQLHGCEDPEFIENLRSIINNEVRYVINNDEVSKENRDNIEEGIFIKNRMEIKKLKIWKGISVKNEDDIKNYKTLNVDDFILDGGNPGSGESFNWNLISGINNNNFFLAGGVGLNNIDEIIKDIKPYGIDVSSGVESIDSYGKCKKDYLKMKILIEKAREII
ncbi:MAG: phosphoribosylanthranilate isomerase [Clostridium sp.]